MTVKELIQQLKNYPDNMDVFIAERKTEFAYGLLNSAYAKEINFSEEPDGEVMSRDRVLVLDEE